MTSARRRPAWRRRHVLAGVEAVIVVGLAVSTNLMSSDLPSWLGWLKQDGRSWVVGGLFLASAVALTLWGGPRAGTWVPSG